MSSIIDKLVDSIYVQTADWIKAEDEISSSTLIQFTTKLMMLVQAQIGKHQGDLKKTVVLRVLRNLIEKESKLTEEAKKDAILILETAIPPFIDVSVSIARGAINLGKGRNLFKACGLGCGLC